MSSFFSYRIMLSVPPQSLLFSKPKEEHFRIVFEEIEALSQSEFNDHGINYHVYNYKSISENIKIWQLAKEQTFNKPMPVDNKIQKVPDIQFPFIYIIFDIEKQLVLIENKTAVFQEIDSVKSKIEKFFIERLHNSEINVSLREVTDERDFWVKISEFDMVQDVELDYNPPNFFKGAKEVDKLVKDVHDETNYQKFTIFLENKISGLNFNFDSFKEHISRLSSGGGYYIIKGVKDGFEQIIKSVSFPFRVKIEDVDSIEKKELDSTFNEINELNEGKNEK